jgi:histidinol-phosphatase (PHP family)
MTLYDKAVDKEFQVFGLSEHMPRYRSQDLYPDEVISLYPLLLTNDNYLCRRLLVTILQHLYDKFVTEARQLRHEYRDRIRLLIGLESELLYPEILDKVQEYSAGFSR